MSNPKEATGEQASTFFIISMPHMSAYVVSVTYHLEKHAQSIMNNRSFHPERIPYAHAGPGRISRYSCTFGSFRSHLVGIGCGSLRISPPFTWGGEPREPHNPGRTMDRSWRKLNQNEDTNWFSYHMISLCGASSTPLPQPLNPLVQQKVNRLKAVDANLQILTPRNHFTTLEESTKGALVFQLLTTWSFRAYPQTFQDGWDEDVRIRGCEPPLFSYPQKIWIFSKNELLESPPPAFSCQHGVSPVSFWPVRPGYMCGEYIVTIRWAKEHSAKQSTINPFEKSLNPNHTFMISGERPLLMRIQILSRFTANKVLLCQERQHVCVNLYVEATCVVPIDSNWMSMTNDGYGNTYVTWVIKAAFESLQNLKSLPTRSIWPDTKISL